MEDHGLSFWIYVGVLTVMAGGAMKKLLASQISSGPTLVAWLGATVLAERLMALWMPAVLLLSALGLMWWLCSASRQEAPLSSEGRAVFITGCDSGFGKATAKRLDVLGFKVFATVLDLSGEGAMELHSICSSTLTLLQVDITKPEQVQQALLDTKAKLGPQGLWGLVNNAGVCVNFGDAELSLMTNYRECMEVNFFGSVTVTKAFLPLLRQEKGRILTISSPAGDQPFPCLAAYGASKAALNLFMNTLRHELEPWGVRVSTILPSSYKTARASDEAYWEEQQKNLIQRLSPALLDQYGADYMNETKELFRDHTRTASEDLSPVIDAVVQALLAPQPRVRYYAGPGVGLMYFIASYFPYSLGDRFLKQLFVKKKLMPLALSKQSRLDLQNFNNNNNEEKLDQ